MQSALSNILLVVLLFSAIALIGLVLIQQSSGGMGGLTGGSSSSLFGARGAGNFLTKMTTIFATVFFVTCIGLAYLYTGSGDRLKRDSSVIDSVISEQGTPTIQESATIDEGVNEEQTQENSDVPLLNVAPDNHDEDVAPSLEDPAQNEEAPESSQIEIEAPSVELSGVEVSSELKEAAQEVKGAAEEVLPQELSAQSLIEAVEKEKNTQ